jgi:pimeloyl-ACP methyl ester carboxylesterase
MVANADALADLLRRHEGLPAVVVGHSYGGGIAVLLAARHPALVAGLVLVASVGAEGSVVALDRVLALPVVGTGASVAALLTSSWLGPRLRRHLSSLQFGPAQVVSRYFPDDGMVAAARDRSSWRSFVVEQRALVAELPMVRDALDHLALPVAVVAGTRDAVVPARASARLAAAIGGAELVLVPGAGHFLLTDAPGVVARAVERVSARAGRSTSRRSPKRRRQSSGGADGGAADG